MKMLELFSLPWHQVPIVFIDTETTGTRPGIDRAVQLGIARFEGGCCVDGYECLVNPGIPIPTEATSIHGITDEKVSGAPSIDDVFAARDGVKKLVRGAQPAAYNAPFDRNFVPPFGDDWTWPWLDTLSLVRFLDRFERGKGRHKLEAACKRHGVELANAHSAGDDARAAGELFYVVARKAPSIGEFITMGELLRRQRRAEADEWFRFNDWLARQPPPLEEGADTR
jgi:DNA polymerase-3 subunit epsilon